MKNKKFRLFLIPHMFLSPYIYIWAKHLMKRVEIIKGCKVQLI